MRPHTGEPWKRPAARTSIPAWPLVAAAASALLAAAPTRAQLPIPASSQFDVTGFIEVASLDPACAASAHCGGTLVVNGQTVTVPRETIVIFPANALTWQEVFAQAPAPYGLLAAFPMTGLAATDLPAPMTTYEAQVIGNRVTGAPGGDQYIAGLIYVSQQGLNSGAGFINFIDYTTGELWVGGALGTATGTRVRINDPSGRFGRAGSPDARFTVDADNPTITAGTGFPMCVPRLAPPAPGLPETDPLCPQAQRPVIGAGPPPVYLPAIQMNDPVALPGVPPDATVQVPFEVGDYVTFAGTLVQDGASPTAGPMPGLASTYVSAHTIEDNIAVYTWPGSNPAYVRTDVTILGTGGLTVVGAGEAAIRTRFEGMSTDPSRNVHLYGIDLAADGTATDRDWGTIGVDPGPPVGAVKGRWRFRPPCTAAVATDKSCTPPPSGSFLPPTREVRAVVEGAWVPGQTTAYANGIVAGQYHAPILEYIFGENVPGSPIVANNFNTIPFLALGGYSSSTGVVAGQLSPWPDASVPTPACTAPTASAGGPYTVASAGAVTLAASASGTAPFTFAWAPPAAGALSDPAVATPIFTAPAAAQVVPLTLVVTNACGSSTSSTSVTVNPAAAPTVAHVAPLSVFSGAAGSFVASATDPGGLAVTFAVAQAGAPALVNLTVGAVTCTVAVPSTCTAPVTFAAPVLPLGQTTTATVNLTITATNAGGTSSAPEFTSVTVKPLPDSVLITATEYRTSKQRLVVNASSSVVSPNVVLTLRPYLTATGTTFDPSQLGNTFTNNGGGLYILTLVGAPEPAVPPATPLVAQSNLNGVSPPHGLDKIRQ